MTKPEWVKPTPYEMYRKGTADAVMRGMSAVETMIEYGFDSLPKQAQPHARGMIAQTYGIDLAPGKRG